MFRPRGVSSMEPGMTESEWKYFRQLQKVALDRFCQRVLSKVGHLAADTSKSSHERYFEVFKRIQQRDQELADAFDGPRRSTALQLLVCLQYHGLLTEEEFARFRPETQALVKQFLES
jgi:hypothetical protein